MRKLLPVLFFFFFAAVTHGQEQPSGGRVQGDRFFERYEYYKALQVYLKMAERDNAPVLVIERIADCYRLLNNYTQAEQWYSRLAKMAGTRPVNSFYYAEMLLRNQKFEEAKASYRSFYSDKNPADLAIKLATADSASKWIKTEFGYKVKPETRLNTNYSEWGVQYKDRNTVVFASDRFLQQDNGRELDNRTGNAWVKPYSLDLTTNRITPLAIDNSEKFKLDKDFHIGPVAFTPVGDTAYITVTTRVKASKIPNDKNTDQSLYTRRLELIIGTRKDNKWGNLKGFLYNNIREFSVGQACLSTDGRILYFTSDMPGGFGKTDIWYCQRAYDGSWSNPINCGKSINTTGDESFPFSYKDKLYFSSNGRPGMGGLDIFVATGWGSDWTKLPANLRYPLNSTSDDFAYATFDGLNGFVASNRQNGKGGDDIYAFVYNGKEVPSGAIRTPEKVIAQLPLTKPTASPAKKDTTPKSPANQTPNNVVKTPAINVPVNQSPGVPMAIPTAVPAVPMENITGTITNPDTGKPIDSVMISLLTSRGELVTSRLITTPNFSFDVKPGQDYTLEARKKGYYPFSIKISSADIARGALPPFKVRLEHLEVGKTFVIRNIYYDLNLAKIRKDAMVELDKLVALMKENPTLRIELSSHTDSRGSDYYNGLLSQARAVSAVAYIKRRGIAANRMVAKGYGETRLMNGCKNNVKCDEEDHQLNRRTEIKVLGIKQ